MKRWRLTALCVVWMTASALGAELAIVGPTEAVKPSEPVWLEITGVSEGAAASFFPSDGLTAGPPHIMPRHALFHAETAGTYQVNAFVTVVDWDARTITTTPLSTKITVSDSGPSPTPPPTPVEDLTGVVIYETQDPDQQKPEFSQIMYGPSIRKLLEGRWHCVDDDVTGDVPATVAGAIAAVKGESLAEPHLFLFDQSGREVYRGPLPASVEATAAKIKEFLP